ncbi:MAG: hypothetical protein C0582_02770 [Alphaproteobacteria bacterium]|nr:MAG: hypothetical protein C0582_02770 [Alphaproteobacteria bacterium]
MKVQTLPISSRLSALMAITFLSSFAYYGFRATLFYYLVQTLGINLAKGADIFIAFIALHFVTQAVCGWLSDNHYGNKIGLLIGSVMIFLGGALSLTSYSIAYYLGFSFLVLGTSFTHVNLVATLGRIMDNQESLRLSAFTLFKVVSNSGIFLTILFFFFTHDQAMWKNLLIVSSMLSGVLIFLLVLFRCGDCLSFDGIKTFTEGENASNQEGVGKIYSLLLLLPLSSVTAFLIWKSEWLGMTVPIVCIVGFFLALHAALIRKMVLSMTFLFALFVLNVCYITLFHYASSAWVGYLTVNFQNHIQSLNGLLSQNYASVLHLPDVTMRVLNSMMVLILGPFFAVFWFVFFKRKNPLSPFLKTAIGFVLSALSFGILTLSKNYYSADGGVDLTWFVCAHLLYAAGELMILPVALSYLTSVAPKDSLALYAGGWLMAGAIPIYLNKYITNFFGLDLLSQSAEISSSTYTDIFGVLSWSSFGLGLVSFMVFLASRKIFEK